MVDGECDLEHRNMRLHVNEATTRACDGHVRPLLRCRSPTQACRVMSCRSREIYAGEQRQATDSVEILSKVRLYNWVLPFATVCGYWPSPNASRRPDAVGPTSTGMRILPKQTPPSAHSPDLKTAIDAGGAPDGPAERTWAAARRVQAAEVARSIGTQ